MKIDEKEIKKKLTPDEYYILREKGTEPPFSGEYVEFNKKGEFVCKVCFNVLFDSSAKFDSDCGWPSFYDAKKESVEFIEDKSLGMDRIEVVCAKCKSHLGHIFNDAPHTPTGNRFCINSLSIKFRGKK